MNKAHNLQLQGGTYHVRFDVPVDVRKAFGGKRILSKSLKTGSLTEAMHRRSPYLLMWRDQVKAARAGVPLPENWQQDVADIAEKIDTNTRDNKRALLGEVNPNAPEADFALLAQAMAAKPDSVLALAQLMLESRNEGLAGQVKFEEELAEAMKGALQRRLAKSFKVSKDEQTEIQALVSNPVAYRPKSPITAAALAAFRAFRTKQNVSPAYIDVQETRLLRLSEYITETGKALDFDCVSHWLDSLRLSGKTQQQHLLAGNALWRWAMKYDARWREAFKGAASPFERHTIALPKGKAAKAAKRKDFTLSDMKRLYDAAQGAGDAPLANLIRLGYYTGARISELCRLRVEHVVTVDGVTMLDIEDSKTASGIRLVPVHPEIASLVTRLVQDSPDGFLVVTDFVSRRGDRTGAIGKAFGALKTSLGYDGKHVFHSIRGTAITQLARHDVSYPMICELIGHQTKTVTFDVYSAGFSAQQKLDAISKIPPFTGACKAELVN